MELDPALSSVDFAALMNRRSMLRFVAGAGVVALAACASSSSSTTSSPTTARTNGAGTSTTPGTTSDTTVTSTPIPEETAGPYPGDGSNGPNLLSEDGIVRRDIRSSFGTGSGTAEGVPTTIELKLLDTNNDAAPLAGAGVYLWHCDRDGLYSLYTAPDANYLRGVQASDHMGVVTFESIFPACYPGRWPHIHFEIYASLADATGGGSKIATSQIAIPSAACNAGFATNGYDQSVANLAQLSLTSDNVFGDDGGVRELATVTGNAGAGYTIALTVPV